MQKPIFAQYVFSETYRNSRNEEETVSVVLEIQYDRKSYNILPIHLKHKEFKFLNGSANATIKWKYMFTAMNRANEFAIKELSEIRE